MHQHRKECYRGDEPNCEQGPWWHRRQELLGHQRLGQGYWPGELRHEHGLAEKPAGSNKGRCRRSAQRFGTDVNWHSEPGQDYLEQACWLRVREAVHRGPVYPGMQRVQRLHADHGSLMACGCTYNAAWVMLAVVALGLAMAAAPATALGAYVCIYMYVYIHTYTYTYT